MSRTTDQTRDGLGSRPARVQPGLLPALLVFVIYVALIFGLQRLIGGDVDYTEIADSSDNFRDYIVIPIGIVSVFLAIVTTYLGWWRPALFEARSTPVWMIAWPVLTIVALVVNIVADVEPWDTEFLVMVLLGFAFVGFSEELMTRGLLLTGARARFGELLSWFISTACFGVMHGLNALNGQDAGTTAVQIALTFVSGTLLYFARRVSGTLLVPMAIHALFDSALTIHAGPGAEFNADTGDPAPAMLVFQVVGGVVLIIALVTRALRRDNPGEKITSLMQADAGQSA